MKNNPAKRDWPKAVFNAVIRLILLLSAVGLFWEKSYFSGVIATACLLLTFLPALVAHRWRESLPGPLQMVIVGFIFASMYLGNVRQFYQRFWWWDKMLHTFSGVLLGLIGFIVIFYLNKEKRLRLSLSPFFVCLFAFVFAVAMGTLWEVYEFTMDSLFGTNMQIRETGVEDTMWDLIVDTLGALAVCVWGYFYGRRAERSPRERISEKTSEASE